jgi:hypothetical protein
MNIRETISASLASTSAKKLFVTKAGLTAEVIFGDLGYAIRCACVLAKDSRGVEHFVVRETEFSRWVGSNHRRVKMLREVEDESGELVSGDIKCRVDAALIRG